jgi:POT family proton-dependent oligopeptide transporter
METTINEVSMPSSRLGKAFWIVWAIELWERFGYYGVQAILALYFVKKLGYSEAQSFYVFGSFSAFVYGFVWIGGWMGDKYLGAKRTLILGSIILTLSYAALALANHQTIFYALAGIVVGNTLFKANPSSLISKMFCKGETALDSAMTLYYMAVNVGSMLSMAVTPIIAERYGWASAFWLCAVGLVMGVGNFLLSRRVMAMLNTEAELQPLSLRRLAIVLAGSALATVVIAQLLDHTKICNWIVYIVVTGALGYFLKIAFSLEGIARKRMFLALILILQAVLFFVLYNQMPTSLTFFAAHNINNQFLGWTIPAAEYQVLNPIVIVIASPLLAWWYSVTPATHVTKFCIGMTLCSAAFLVLAIPQFVSHDGFASPEWMVLTYVLQSVGELFISGLGLAMVAELCPASMSGFVMGIWYLAVMLAGPIGAWVGALTTTPEGAANISAVASMHIYGDVFLKIGLVTGALALIMWLKRPLLNRLVA